MRAKETAVPLSNPVVFRENGLAHLDRAAGFASLLVVVLVLVRIWRSMGMRVGMGVIVMFTGSMFVLMLGTVVGAVVVGTFRMVFALVSTDANRVF